MREELATSRQELATQREKYDILFEKYEKKEMPNNDNAFNAMIAESQISNTRFDASLSISETNSGQKKVKRQNGISNRTNTQNLRKREPLRRTGQNNRSESNDSRQSREPKSRVRKTIYVDEGETFTVEDMIAHAPKRKKKVVSALPNLIPCIKEAKDKYFRLKGPKIWPRFKGFPEMGPFLLGEDVYRGQFRKGQRHGFGIEIKNDGSSYYEGYWKYGHRQGEGLFINSRGDLYLGKWENGKPNKKGELYGFNHRFYYKGDFQGYRQNGIGKMIYYKSGSVYKGEWRDGQRNGKGTLSVPNEGTYFGVWDDGKKHGKMEFTDLDGQKFSQEWEKGELIHSQMMV